MYNTDHIAKAENHLQVIVSIFELIKVLIYVCGAPKKN